MCCRKMKSFNNDMAEFHIFLFQNMCCFEAMNASMISVFHLYSRPMFLNLFVCCA